MSFLSLLVDTVEITTPDVTVASTDRYGNETFDTVTNTYPARVQPATDNEQDEELRMRDTRRTLFKIFLPGGAVIDGLSTIAWEGRTLRVVGEIGEFRGDTATVHHIQAFAEEVLG